MTRRKIAFLIRSLEVGGAQRQLVELAKGLRGAGWDVLVLTYYAGAPFEHELAREGIRHVPLGKRGRWDVVAFTRRLVQVLRAERPSVVHGYLPDANCLLTLLRPFLRGARIVWGVRASVINLSAYHWLSAAIFRASCRLSRRADLIICNSQVGAAAHVGRGYPAARTVVVPNGIDTARFRCDPVARARLRAEWGVANDAPLIGLVGRLDPVKDHETFLRAAAALVRVRPDARFAFVGDGNGAYAARLRALADSLGLGPRLVWSPARDDVTAVYCALDILTLCSVSEGFPNVVGEAMACGTPCVVSRTGDSPWIVGDTGAVVAVGDAEELARAWTGFLTSVGDAARAARCRDRMVRDFGLDALVRNTVRVLGRLEASA